VGLCPWEFSMLEFSSLCGFKGWGFCCLWLFASLGFILLGINASLLSSA